MSDDERRAQQKAKRIQQVQYRCKHFTGIQHDQCAAGVPYASVRPKNGGGLPCFLVDPRGRMAEGECPRVVFPTPEEAEREYEADEAVFARTTKAHRAAHEDAEAKRFGKGQGGADSLPCPVCTTGRIYYRVAGYNGHMHAKCETEGCVSWME